MEDLLSAIEGSALSQSVRFSQWTYASVNTAHVFGLALLVGAIVPLDLRLLGFWKRISHVELSRVLVPIAAIGLITAVLAGTCLFVVRAEDYGVAPLFFAKMGLVIVGTLAALRFHLRAGLWLQHAARRTQVLHGALSLVCWVGALVCGRMIAYVVT